MSEFELDRFVIALQDILPKALERSLTTAFKKALADAMKLEKKQGPVRRVPQKDEETIFTILDCEYGDPGYRAFWTFCQVWPQDKNPMPKATAKAWVKALEKAPAKDIYRAALQYREDKEPKYMVNIAKWLDNEGWSAYVGGPE